MLQAALSVEEIILMGRFSHLKSAFSGYDKSDYDKLEAIMQKLDLLKFKGRNALGLSGGEFGRVLLARALIGEPKVLLLDEPTSALDLNYSVEIMKLCAKLSAEFGICTIAVLHDLNLASMFCGKICMLKAGKVAYEGTPNELYKAEILHEIYGLKCDIIDYKGRPIVVSLK